MPRSPATGLAIALAGVLVLTPDTLLMRWSEMGGFQMSGWRGLLMGAVLIAVAIATRRSVPMRGLWTGAGAAVVAAHAVNATLFSVGIAVAPVSIVLIGVATVPVFSAVLSAVLLGERTPPAAWITMAVVLAGIALAVSGDGGGGSVLLGALAGLGVAASLATTFVIVRGAAHVPIALAIGCGALLSGALGVAITGPGAMTEGVVWPILVAGAIILPVSFFAMSTAARLTLAANVSLILLLETVLGPAWVWLGTGEAPTARMVAGGAVVLGALAAYLVHERRRERRAARRAGVAG